ncbi:AbrB family transcriptional regulator [Silvimonas iriomotensis]|uniref:Ammonia monooxygenase n=1 Tax=Silvimonas iriomotensis TaxID=449662 RepID=A0ABQ2P9H5_9NEIS|nr:AbrB family transcriptional regulator [Silvimonas iriomotensis]GGP21507.1 ammonia monooxygenase [Silvimonas iriomotensis]
MPTSHADTTRPGRLAGTSARSQWLILLALSAVLGAGLAACGLPAALLLGPMIAGIIVTANGGSRGVAPLPFQIAQSIVGAMIARTLPGWVHGDVGGHWLLFVGGVFSVLAVCVLLGWLLTRMQVLPGSTAMWGLSPGAATTMTLMAEAFGADVQLVALMQYLRVMLVAAAASIITRVLGAHAVHGTLASTNWWQMPDWTALAGTVALAAFAIVISRRFRLRAGAMLIPMFGGMLLVHLGWLKIELPVWLLVAAYAIIGWHIGLKFTRPLLQYAARALPRILLCTLALIAACGGLAVVLVQVAGVDPLTAYLATSPGGADTVAIIAASSHVDVSFVMAMQVCRFMTILLLSPLLARLMARRGKAAARP